MAGDWIKMETSLTEKPEVVALSSSLSVDRFSVVGRLHKLWSWFNHHTENGYAPGVTPAFLDSLVSLDGFVSALESVGWIHFRNNGISLPKFERHNGKSAKNRALSQERMQRSRYGASATKPSPEKRREEKSNKPPLSPKGDDSVLFQKWWESYPRLRRTGKPKALQSWQAAIKSLVGEGASRTEAIAKLQASVEEFAASPKGKSQYVPAPTVWLNQARYDDDRQAWQLGDKSSPNAPQKCRVPNDDELARWNPYTGGDAL